MYNILTLKEYIVCMQKIIENQVTKLIAIKINSLINIKIKAS